MVLFSLLLGIRTIIPVWADEGARRVWLGVRVATGARGRGVEGSSCVFAE